MNKSKENNIENSSLNTAGYSVTLTFQEWQSLLNIIEIGILNIPYETRKKYDEEYQKLFEKMNKQFEIFTE